MSRLTKRNGKYVEYSNENYNDSVDNYTMLDNCLRKLADYEDAEEQCIKDCGVGLNMVVLKYKEFLEHMHELAEYWKLEEQGLLLRLPCKVGDTVWEVGEIQPHIITKCKVDKFATDEAGVVYIKYHSDNFSAKRYLDAFGDTLFITKEEAERRI